MSEPRELTGVQLEQVGERAGRDDLRHRPADPPHPRLVQEPARDVRPRAVDVRLAERQRDVLRELARAIHRRARIRDHRRAHDRGQPARARGRSASRPRRIIAGSVHVPARNAAASAAPSSRLIAACILPDAKPA